MTFSMLSVVYAECLKYALYAHCHYAECRGALDTAINFYASLLFVSKA